MSAPHIILDCLPSLCQKLSALVEVLRSYNKNNFACFLLRHGVYSDMIWHVQFWTLTCMYCENHVEANVIFNLQGAPKKETPRKKIISLKL